MGTEIGVVEVTAEQTDGTLRSLCEYIENGNLTFLHRTQFSDYLGIVCHNIHTSLLLEFRFLGAKDYDMKSHQVVARVRAAETIWRRAKFREVKKEVLASQVVGSTQYRFFWPEEYSVSDAFDTKADLLLEWPGEGAVLQRRRILVWEDVDSERERGA